MDRQRRDGNKGGIEAGRRRVGLIDYENDPSSSPWIHTFPMWLLSSLVSEWVCLVPPLNLGGTCDLL